MLLELGADQQFFRDTTARFLDDRVPADELRRLRDDPVGFDLDYWRQGAQLGWTSLLVGEDLGGGSLSDHGIADLAVLAHELGRHGAPGPLLAANVVTAAVAEAGGEGQALLGGLLTGEVVATWCPDAAGADPGRAPAVEVAVDGDDVVVQGTARRVEAAQAASHVLVTGRTGDGLTQVLVPLDAPGVAVVAMRAVDLTRRFAVVELHDVRLPTAAVVGTIGEAADQVARQRRLALTVSTAESVGAMQSAFDMTVAWAFDRYSFGRPLASYQEVKHRFADMRTWLEASHAVSDDATTAVAAGAPEAEMLMSAAKAFIGHYGSELLQDCVQLHGGIGVTFDHDLHIFLRRHTLDRGLYGTPAEHRQRLAELALMEEAR